MIELNSIDLKIINEIKQKENNSNNYLDFLNSDVKTLTHRYHVYPAMMIPNLAKEFIETTLKYQENIKNIYDPFMGSGTTLVEGIAHNLEVFGQDINPLSFFMTNAKTQTINPDLLEAEILNLKLRIQDSYQKIIYDRYDLDNIPNFKNIDYWFKPEVIKKLQIIKNCINSNNNIELRNFYLVAFSETVRYVSNSRNNEFKLYRLAENKLATWNPDVIKIFFEYLSRNEIANNKLFKALESIDNLEPKITINQHDTSHNNIFPDNSFDLLVTSPPYGDSSTTVAYGQFSRLSLQWLDLEIDENTALNKLDSIMLGGKIDKKVSIDSILDYLGSSTLEDLFKKINEKDEKRARQVLQFFIDLDSSLENIARLMKNNTYQYWVVANRTVKMISVPTDIIITEMFEKYEVFHLHSFYRNIPNKRMPSKNSPTNIVGNHSVTMNSEIILMFRKSVR
ncbi:DNA methylase [Staphylococcus haemolyticus]|uniref:DNA methylase n=1 Tax=Staphylococcus haemolyticus TaxID=1283 RepID=UPI000E69CE6E|nr:DNA methylase [Staphylococcus haemolyticus]RIO63545.1 DNA methylase [Staphylococcus haemolyticus]